MCDMLGGGSNNLQNPIMLLHPLLTVSDGFGYITVSVRLFREIRLERNSYVGGDKTGKTSEFEALSSCCVNINQCKHSRLGCCIRKKYYVH